MSISRRDFTKYGLSAAAIAAGTKMVLPTGESVSAFTGVTHQKEWDGTRRVGLRPNGVGAYWGGGSEQIDVLSGNLNYSIPLFDVGGRGINVKLKCSYNSQQWERANSTVIVHGQDTGVGYGWIIQLGCIVPNYSDGNIAGYSFINDTGAEFHLSLSRGVWICAQGLYISFDPSGKKLQFSDGSFWVMGCASASVEADVGVLYPTVLQDKNGNRVRVRYMRGMGAQQDNTSGRILEIVDFRAVETDSGRRSYSFAYSDESTPQLLSITSHVDAKENCYFTREMRKIVSPFGGNGNGAESNDFTRVLKSFRTGGNPEQGFEYNEFGEMEQAQLPYGARFRWWYETTDNKDMVRIVSCRGVTLSYGEEEAVWEISFKQNNGKDARRVTTLNDPSGRAKQVWSFNADLESEECGLLSMLEVKENGRTLRHISYLWKSTMAGIPYVGTIVTALDPGTPQEATCREEIERDIFGNLTESRKYDFSNPFQPIRVISNTYLTEPEYIERGICDLLLTSTIGDGRESTEWIRNQYDTTILVDLQNISGHDPEYGTRHTVRGNLTEVVVGGVYNRIVYDIAGVVDSFEDGVGNRKDFSGDKQAGVIKANKVIPDSAMISGFQNMMRLNTRQNEIAPTIVNIEFSAAWPFIPECGYQSLDVESANTKLRKTSDGVYKLSVFDDFQRLIRIEKGGKDGVESIINYEWEHTPNAPLGLCLRASLPHAPGAEPEWVEYEYDSLGRQISRDMLSHGGKEQYVYKGNSATVVNARGGRRKLSIDPIGKLRKVTMFDPQEGTATETDYQYNHQGCLESAILPRNEGTQRHTFVYDSGRRLISGNRAESGHEEHSYNVDGMLASRMDARGQRTEYSYDAKKRLISIKRFDSVGQVQPEQCVKYYYDVNPFEDFFAEKTEGQLTAAQWGDENILPGMITEMYSSSPYGRLKAKRIRINRAGKSVDIDLNYVYNASGRITEIAYTGGQSLNYKYDSMGRQSALICGMDVLVKDAVYTPAGLLASFQQLVPGTDEYITEIRTIDSTCKTRRILAEQSGNPLVDVEYEYSGEDGRLTVNNDRLSSDLTTYDYDSMGRLKKAESKNRDWEIGYEHDGFGSLSSKKQKNGRGRSFTARHNPKTNRVQMDRTVEYDANGNIINHFGTKLSFDIENRLTEASRIGMGVESYGYDTNNQRIWKKYPDGVEEFYLYGEDNKLLATYRLTEDSTGEISLSLIDRNVYFSKRLVRSRGEAVVLDRTGNVKAGSNRETVRRMRYAPFGEEETVTGENRIKFGTYFRDEATGLDYAKRRYYSPVLGRFINPDPYLGSIRPGNPDTWNRYAYCQNDPINNIDPNGTYCLNGYDPWCNEWDCPATWYDYQEGYCDLDPTYFYYYHYNFYMEWLIYYYGGVGNFTVTACSEALGQSGTTMQEVDTIASGVIIVDSHLGLPTIGGQIKLGNALTGFVIQINSDINWNDLTNQQCTNGTINLLIALPSMGIGKPGMTSSQLRKYVEYHELGHIVCFQLDIPDNTDQKHAQIWNGCVV